MSRAVLLATTNAGKLREVTAYLAGIPGLALVSLRDVPPMPEVEEDGATFRENAVKKAIEYGRASGHLTLADDSGLCVDALGGEPGVRSARFGGVGLDDPGRCRYLLARLEGIEPARRTARFECVLALADAGRLIEVFTGQVEGRILDAPRGTNGFGYDPVFFYEPAGRTFAELPAAEKSAVSHRGRALSSLRACLEANPALFS